MPSLRYTRHLAKTKREGKARPTTEFIVIRGAVCGACGRDERRKHDKACIHCLWHRGLHVLENPDGYSKGETHQAFINTSQIAQYDRRKAASKRGAHARRARIAEAPGAFTSAQTSAILDAQSGRCAYCSEKNHLHLDHAIPLARGGSNWPWNLQWLCAFHNMSKGVKTDAEYRREIGLSDEVWISLKMWSAALLLPPEALIQNPEKTSDSDTSE